MTDLITCPQCAHEFEPSAILRSNVERELREELGAVFATQKIALDRQLADTAARLSNADSAVLGLEQQKMALEEAHRQERLEADRRLEVARADGRAEAEQRAARTQAEALEQLSAAKDAELDQLRERVAAAVHAEAQLLRLQRDLADRESALELTVEKRIAAERAQLEQRAHAELEARLAIALEEGLTRKERELEDARRRLQEFAGVEEHLVQTRGELEQLARRSKAEAERQVQEAVRAFAEEAQAASAHQKALVEAEQKEQLRTLTAKIREAEQKAMQGSQQLQGDAQEVVIRDLLTRTCPTDSVADVPTGVHGGDVLQHVRDELGHVAATVLWESKRTKGWSDGWLTKLAEDQMRAGATCSILVSTTLPAGMDGFGERSGIWICQPRYAEGMAQLVRRRLLELGRAREALEGRGDKETMLFGYVTSGDFQQRVEATLRTFVEMEDTLAKERRAMLANWQRRERQLCRVRENLAAVCGDVRGIVGGLAEVSAFELDETEGEDVAPPSSETERLELLFELVPDGGTIGSGRLSELFFAAARARLGLELDEGDYRRLRDELVAVGRLVKGRGRGGTLARCHAVAAE